MPGDIHWFFIQDLNTFDIRQVNLNTNYYLKKSLNPGAGWPATPNVQLTLTNALSGAEINNRKFNSENEDYNNYRLRHPITLSLFLVHYSIFWAKHSGGERIWEEVLVFLTNATQGLVKKLRLDSRRQEWAACLSERCTSSTVSNQTTTEWCEP